MTLNEALELFGIDDISLEDDTTLKKKYKKLMIKYHPDNCNGDENKAKEVAEAFEVLKDALNAVKKYSYLTQKVQELNIIIPLSKLLELYKGGSITVGYDNVRRVITKKDIQKHNTLIISDVTLTHKGMVHTFNSIQPWTIGDKYEINCDIYVDDITKQETVKIHINNFEKEIKFVSQSIVMNVTLDFNVNVAIRITKKTLNNDSDDRK